MIITKPRGDRDTSASRFNHVSHGLRSRYEVIPGESQEEYDSFKKEINDDLKPCGALENTLVERLVFFLWRLKRAMRAECTLVFANLKLDKDPVDWGRLLGSNLLDQIVRYESHATRQISKILEELRKLRAEKIH